MTDQCKFCELRGDYEKCITAECGHHENWINLQRIDIIKKQQERIDYLEEIDRANKDLINTADSKRIFCLNT